MQLYAFQRDTTLIQRLSKRDHFSLINIRYNYVICKYSCIHIEKKMKSIIKNWFFQVDPMQFFFLRGWCVRLHSKIIILLFHLSQASTRPPRTGVSIMCIWTKFSWSETITMGDLAHIVALRSTKSPSNLD